MRQNVCEHILLAQRQPFGSLTANPTTFSYNDTCGSRASSLARTYPDFVSKMSETSNFNYMYVSIFPRGLRPDGHAVTPR